MALRCGCGVKAAFQHVHSQGGLCADCYKGLDADERAFWVERRMRLFGR